MPVETIYVLGESQISISGGAQLSGITQGDGSHLDGRTITLNSNAWETIDVDDSDGDFQDSDNSQRLDGAQTLDGVLYADNLRAEAEYGITVEDPDGNTYQLLGFNINEGGGRSFATVEGLAFVGGVGGFPPRDVPLTVISTQEGPGYVYSGLATPPCFVAGSLIEVLGGAVPVETLQAGDQVLTRDNGVQTLRWVGHSFVPKAVLVREPEFRPIRLRAGSLRAGVPSRDTFVSPQHRVLVTGWRAELHFGESEILVPAHKLINDHSIRPVMPEEGVHYVHLMFDAHEIVRADGMPSESLLVTETTLELAEGCREARRLFPQLRYGPKQFVARPCYADRRAAVLFAEA